MTDPGRESTRRTGRAPRPGGGTTRRAILAAALLGLLTGAAATAPTASAGPRSDAARNEASRSGEPRNERRNVVAAPRQPIVRGDGPRGSGATGAAVRDRTPVRIAIPAIGVDAPVETLGTVDQKMQDPTGPDVVAWYDDTDALGAAGNAVFAGHLDYAGVGPAVFADLSDLSKNDRVLVTAGDGDVYAYRVDARRIVSAAAGPWDALTASTDRPTLTLITCAGPWDAALGHYRDRLVVRAVRVGS